MSHVPAVANQNQRGFALLTVIVIVMALTILGLSLFSLSSFEAQFFRPTMDYAQAMESTRGGIEWARYVLESTDSFDKVRTSAKPPGVSGVVARKGLDFDSADSTGAVFVDPPKLVWVRSVGSENGREGAVLARFNPAPGQDLYKRLITVMDSMVIDTRNNTSQNTLLSGNIRMRTVDIHDYDGANVDPGDFKGTHCVGPQQLPGPELDLHGDWWNQKYAASQNLSPNATILMGVSGQTKVYRTLQPGTDAGGRVWSAILPTTTVQARGTSIWMFQEGLRCEGKLTIELAPGESEANVILVGIPGGGPPTSIENNVGFTFLGGVEFVKKVNVFIVTDGGVEIEHVDGTGESHADYLSIYAGFAKFMGPLDPGGDLQLYHGTSCNSVVTQDAKDGVVDKLIENNSLPNSRFARRRLQFVAGSWEEKSATVGN